ncbi:MAG: ChaN family lipoprotein [Flavobacteriales bacterium]|nr:ChaN family lipoprotein [Flavobacteriales bacterium]
MRSILLPFLFLCGFLQAQDPVAYRLFTGQGKPANHKAFMKSLGAADVILFGEQHNSAIAHWLQLVVARELAAKAPLAMGAEMIEADDQATLDRYLRGQIDQAAFDTLVRLWKNHSDYAPMVELAKEKGLRFIATNVPRRYASMVYKGGFEALDTLPDVEKEWIAPLPIAYDPELPGYKAMLDMGHGHASPTMPKAQALKDATMAHFILANFKPGTRFLHFNGTYHSDNYEGISWYLKRARPELRIVTIATTTQADASKLEAEHKGKADFILVVDEAVPGTY